MERRELPYRLEELLTSFYRLETVERINYVQYVPSKSDAQWSIQAELALRKHNPRILASLFSRELWCFSINSDSMPSLELDQLGNAPAPEKTGYFTPDISKPNLPTAYAVFLKALRRMIHINLCLESKQQLVPFGNSCLFKANENASKVVHFEPQLFENGDLCMSICTKEMRLCSLDVNMINEPFLKKNAIYLAPSGIRAYLVSPEVNKCISPAPKNASVLLITLLVSHGIDLTEKKDLTWVKVTPNLDHLNGYTPSIAGYLDPPKATKTAIWPLELCFSQPSATLVNSDDSLSFEPNLQETFDFIDDFIQLKLTSAFKTPGSTSGGLGTGTVTGNNALSTGGIYGDHYPAFHKHTQSGSLSTLGIFNSQTASRQSPSIAFMNTTPVNNRSAPQSTETLNSGFLTTPNINQNVETANDEMSTIGSPHKMRDIPWTAESKGSINGDEISEPSNGGLSDVSTSQTCEGDSDLDTELFGNDNEEENEEAVNINEVNAEQHVKDITDDMFDIDDESDSSREKTAHLKEPSPFNIEESPFKRKYLDIPLDEMTLPTTPLYMDPGAPLPIETPRDRRKSVFAPLNFNPIIESNVDNKYKNGGKFSFDGGKIEESLKFDVSTANISSSEDEESGSSVDDFDVLSGGNNIGPSLEGNPPLTVFPSESQPQTTLDVAQLGVFKEPSPPQNFDNNGNVEKSARENHFDMWKYPRGDTTRSYSPSKGHSQPRSMKLGQVNIGSNDPDDLTKISSITPLLDQPRKSPAISSYFSDTNSEGAERLDSSENMSTESIATPESSNSLPFLLRHMPLFSIPGIFFHQNPSLPFNDNFTSVLNLLSEQIIFDKGLLGDLSCEPITYNNFIGCDSGIVKTTVQSIFSKFQRLNGGELIEEINYIRQPAVYVKKNDELIKIKGDAEPFSSHLNLKPYKGIKSFRCLFLTTDRKDDCLEFLSSVSQIYSRQELGFCELVKLTSADTPGLIYLINLEKDTLLLLSAQLVSYLSTNTFNTKSVPLVIFLPIRNQSLRDVVSTTLKFEFLQKEVKSKLPNVNIFLKVIPMNFISNPLTSVEDYYDLCVGIYNSIPPKNMKFTAIADEVPKRIEFRTNQQANGQTSHFDMYIHLAYARSIDRNWICAAWSNSSGSDNGVETWYIGNSTTAFEDACNQMWQTTSKCAANNYGRVCLVLTRFDSVLPDDELMHWRRLSSASRSLHLAVVCVGDSTKLSLYDEDRMYPSFKPLFEDDRLSKKIEISNLDNYEIVDAGSEVHGIIFQNPLQLANSQHRCAIITGALVRFKSNSGHDILDKLEINLLNCPHSDSTKLLKIILQEFRNLAVLNTWFGLSKSEFSFIPWHVLAVKKMIKTVVHLKVTEST
ncbi:LANO_0H12332g1_1 [Lachancea nothofagi CBS 11611]|uniref:Mediator of RNA polymerase II transcription subunit 13 n=1 Tax=Lachancea nothofagi CBS 11611 TaxID=1266666 RepID=A0A1G4KML3_9SACH|nr:LANO_0H12332g1_1 [Lachancea nothofagi CBS 11611]